MKGAKKMSDFQEFKAELLKDPEVKKEYDNMRAEFDIIKAIIVARNEQKLTQKELAKRAGLRQANISRMESGTYNPSVKTLKLLAKGLGKELHIEFR